MAGDKKPPSIPDWQRPSQPSSDAAQTNENNPSTSAIPKKDLDVLEQARIFLEDEGIQSASRDLKVAFLERKGISTDDIQKLLGPESQAAASPAEETEFKTVHDSNTHSPQETTPPPGTPREPELSASSSLARTTIRSDIPPIITYPEFLLKPQKPPPLVTVERLTNAAYVLAGLSALTYGASKYLVQPMLESLTEARHELAESAKQDLHKLNTKLESSVSHIPYIASSAVLKKELDTEHSDTESIVSDPTELFHRDIATQTSPTRSRSASLSSSTNLAPQDPTAHQTSRLASLYTTLSSLVSSTNITFSENRLKESISDFQGVLDKLESTHSPFSAGYTSTYLPSATDDKTRKKGSYGSENEAVKFKTEIRALKGAFLSSRNFPTARPTVPFTMPAR